MCAILTWQDAAFREYRIQTDVSPIIARVPVPAQPDLLAALTLFAELLIAPARLVQLITKERMMQSELIRYLTDDIIAERERAFVERERAFAERERAFVERIRVVETEAEARATAAAVDAEARAAEIDTTARLRAQQSVVRIIGTRFPTAPGRLLAEVAQIPDLATVQDLVEVAAIAPDLMTVEAAVVQARRRAA